MRIILRYLLFCGSLILVVWLLFGLHLNNRSIYSHLRTLGSEPTTSLLAEIRREFNMSSASVPDTKTKRSITKAKKPAPTPRQIQDHRVEKLKVAARKANPSPAVVKRPSSKETKKTRIDDRISHRDEKALDELLTARLDRLK